MYLQNNASPLRLKNEFKALVFLVFFHILIITLSNYLVQFTIRIAGIDTTLGSFTFPFVFLATDLTVRIFGTTLARTIISWTMLPALCISYAVSSLFDQGNFRGLAALASFNLFVFRIALASFSAYVAGQLLDIFVFNKLRQKKAWWIAPSGAAVIGSAVDTLLFFFVAFYASTDYFLAHNWFSLAVVDYGTKLLICGLFFLPAYGIILNRLMGKIKSNQDLHKNTQLG